MSRPTSSSTYVTEASHSETSGSQAQARNEPDARPFDTFQRQALMFTGPDGLRNQRVRVEPAAGFVGEGETSKERTGALSYLFRSANGTPFPMAKNGRLGEIGGEVDRWNLKKGI